VFDLITFSATSCGFASVTAIVLMIPGAGLLLLLERFLKSEYLVFFGQL